MHTPTLFRLQQNAQRANEVVRVLARYGLADWLGGLNYRWLQAHLVSSGGEALGELTREARIRLALTELGTTYIKFGQMLSTRADLVGPALVTELAKLRSNTPPDPPDVVRATILAEFGKPIEELFREFQDQPLASASIGQVYPARLASGQVVVVKVQHAGIAKKIVNDLDIMAGLAELLQKHLDAARAYQPVALMREFRRLLLNELDFSSERRHLERFRTNFADDLGVHFPAVHPDLCSRRVLTMEMLVGTSVEDVEGLRGAGVDPERLAQRGAGMYLQMIFRDGFYHADPHPGNLMLLPGEVIGVLDCGRVGRIDDRLKRDLEELVLGVISGDAEEVAGVVMRLGTVPPDLDRDAFRSELGAFVTEYGSRQLRDISLDRALNEITDIVRRYRITLPTSCSLLLKTLMMLEGVGRQLSPNFSLIEFIRPFAARMEQQRFSPQRLVGRLGRTFRDWDRLLDTLPRDLADIVQRLRNSAFQIQHWLTRVEAAVDRLTLGLLSAGLFVGSSLMLSHAVAPTLGGVSVLGVAGYLAAVALAVKLLRSIGQSGG